MVPWRPTNTTDLHNREVRYDIYHSAYRFKCLVDTGVENKDVHQHDPLSVKQWCISRVSYTHLAYKWPTLYDLGYKIMSPQQSVSGTLWVTEQSAINVFDDSHQ